MCINRDPGTSLPDRNMGTFQSYKPTAGIESGGVVLQKPRIYSKCKRGLSCFEALGQTIVGEGFSCEFDVSAIVVNVYLRRYIRWHNLILKTCCYHISDIKISVYIHRRFQFLAEMSPGPLHNAACGQGHCGLPPLNPCLSILNGLLQHIDFGFYFSISVFLFILPILLFSLHSSFKRYLLSSSHSTL
jgi:hypothetical protein